jgi:uncharacterized protein YkwD
MIDSSSDGDWLQLTEEDIARAYQISRARPVQPEAVIIGLADIGPDEPVRPARPGSILTITLDDLLPTGAISSTSDELGRLEQLMFSLLNQARQDHLPGWLRTAVLKWDDRLAAVARGHSTDMLRRQYIAHASPEGISAARRLEASDVRYVACGENIGVFYGEPSPGEAAVREIHGAFMNEPRSLTNHRGNLLNPIWTHAGVGIARNPDGALVVTQDFISAPAARLRGT